MRIVFFFLFILCFTPLNSQNLGFESGNFNNWNLYSGENNRLSIFGICINNGIKNIAGGLNSPNHHNIMTPGFDPLLGGSVLPRVIEGNFSARIGSYSVGLKASRLSRDITVSASEPFLKINYAIVMKDPGHNRCRNPYFQIRITKQNGSKIYEERIIADNSDPYFKTASGHLYKDWDCNLFDLAAYVGQTVRLEIEVRDCSKGARDHFTYVYIDGINKDVIEADFTMPKDVYCANEIITANASASYGEIDHFWSIEESDQFGNRYPSTEVSKWFTASQAGSINLSNLYQSLGGTFKCNTYYRIKLAVKNNCVPWKEVTKLIQISCPIANAGADICCSDQSPDIIGSIIPNPDYTYQWSPQYGVSNPTNSSTLVDCDNDEITEQGDCFEYQLTVTDQYGCQATDEVRVFFAPPKFTLSQAQGCCGVRLFIQDDGCYTDIQWSTGESNVREIQVDEAGTYSVTLTNTCGQTTKSITVTNVDLVVEFQTIYPEFIAGAGMTPNGDGINDELVIYHFASDAPLKGQPIAYNATEYELHVVGRSGVVYKVAEGNTCDGFYNGEIRWDGKINGQLVQDGVYTYFLKVRNCAYPWIEVPVITGTEFECIDCGFTLIGDRHCPGIFNGCKEFGEKMISSTRPSVTLLK
jgi:hypothetical protein